MKIEDDFLYQVMPLAEERLLSDIPSEEDLHHKFSRRFRREMNRLVKYERRTPRMRRAMYYTKAVSVVIAAMLFILITITMSVKAYRIRFFQFFTRIWEELTSTVVEQEGDGITGNDILLPVEPSILPEGYDEVERVSDQYEQVIIYRNSDGNEILYSQRLLTQEEGITDTEDAMIETLSFHGTDLWIIEKNETVFIRWMDLNHFYQLMGREKESLLSITKNILENK